MKLRVAIIDDEIHAIETLTYDLKEGFENKIEIIFSATNPVEGLKKIKSELPDLVFLDIEMPGLSGIDVLSLIDDLELQVVITTAHEEFAIQAVGTKAIAYLLKPVQLEDLETIIEQVIGKKQSKKATSPFSSKISVPVFDGIEIIRMDEILYLKSDGNYSEIILLGEKKIIASKTLKYFTSFLPLQQFIRIHKSHLVNLNHIKKYLKSEGGEVQMINNDVLPVSRNKRDEILKLIQSHL